MFDDQVGEWVPTVELSQLDGTGNAIRRARFRGLTAIDESTGWHHLVGEAALGEIQLDAGETATLSVEAEALEAEPFEFTSILLRDRNRAVADEVLTPASVRSVQRDGCTGDDRRLCLTGSRFEVRVAWEDFQGGVGGGTAVPLTSDTGYFWFFRDTNVELIVKVLDGRPINGHWWVFYGALSNVEYRITVTDTETMETKSYDNPARTFASRGDTEAF